MGSAKDKNQPKADKIHAENALLAACHDISKMEASTFGMPIDPGRAERLFGYYLERAGDSK